MVDTKLESKTPEEIGNNNERIVDVEAVNTKSEVPHDHQPSLDNQTSQCTNITLVDGNSRSSHVEAPTVGTGTIVIPSETIVDDYSNSTDYDSDDSYMFYDYGDGTDESDDEESSDNSLHKAISVLSSELQSCRNLTTHSLSDTDTNNDANANGNALVVAGCRMCMLYIMLPAGINVCFRCGNSGLIHFGGNGQA